MSLTAAGSEGRQMYGEALIVPWWSVAGLPRQSAGPGSSYRWFPPAGQSTSYLGFCCLGHCLWCGHMRSASAVQRQGTGWSIRGRIHCPTWDSVFFKVFVSETQPLYSPTEWNMLHSVRRKTVKYSCELKHTEQPGSSAEIFTSKGFQWGKGSRADILLDLT